MLKTTKLVSNYYNDSPKPCLTLVPPESIEELIKQAAKHVYDPKDDIDYNKDK